VVPNWRPITKASAVRAREALQKEIDLAERCDRETLAAQQDRDALDEDATSIRFPTSLERLKIHPTMQPIHP
jgi:hypothetical protein